MSEETRNCPECGHVMMKYFRQTKEREGKLEWICRPCQNRKRKEVRDRDKRMSKLDQRG